MRRNTKQRSAIRRALTDAGRPLAPMEILESAQEAVPGLGIATVYRTVNLLVEEGWAVVVELPDASPRYERSGKGHHHHFLCTDCDAAYDVSGCPSGVGDLTPQGFELAAHEIVLYGRCRDCVTGA
jgi:Fur family transcriptional regulator, ferric uptake regulator